MAVRFGFRTRLTLFALILLSVLQGANIFLVSRELREIVLEYARRDLDISAIMLADLVREDFQIALDTSLLSLSDLAMLQALAGGDPPAKASVLETLESRSRAEGSAFIDREGVIGVLGPGALTGGLTVGERFAFPRLIEQAELSEVGGAYGIGVLGETLALVIVVAVDHPRTLGYVAKLFELDVAALPDRMPIGLTTSVFVTDGAEGTVLHRFSALPGALVDAKQAALTDPALRRGDSIDLVLGGEVVHAAMLPLQPARPERAVLAVFHTSLDQALARAQGLFVTLWLLLAASFLPAAASGWVLARTLSRPIRELTEVAATVEAGNYRDLPEPAPRHDEFGTLQGAFATMVERVEAREARLRYLARHDPLTGLPNRGVFIEQLEATGQAGRTVCVLRIQSLHEIDYVFGRTVTDRTVTHLARTLADALPGDPGEAGGPARIGDDMFAFCLPETEATTTALGLAEQFEAAQVIDGNPLDLIVRIGVSAGAETETAEAKIQQAEAALHHGTVEGRTITLFDPARDTPDPDLLTLMGEMQTGLEAGEFKLFLQPKLTLATGRIEAAEALIRWFHPTRGFVPPDKFIPLAEQTGRIALLTHWVVSEAIRLAASLRDAGHPLMLGINLSTRDITDENLPGFIAARLAEAGLGAESLALEITESGLMNRPDAALAILRALRAAGHEMAIDDFGTGYSSLAYLQKLPVTEIKIDRAFIRELTENPADEAITRATIELAHALGRKATAEGMEDQATLDALKALGCDTAQGYHIAKPMNDRDLLAFLGEWRG